VAELLRKQQQVIAVSPEVTYGVDAVPTGSKAVLAQDLVVNMLESETATRNNMNGRLGAQGSITVAKHISSSFGVEFAGSGVATTPPAWGELLKSCGMAEVVGASTVTYTPVDAVFGSVSAYYRIAKMQQKLLGSRGKFVLNLDNGSIPMIKFDILSLYQAPTVEAAVLAGVDTSAYKNPLGVISATAGVTFLGSAVQMSKLSIDLGVGVKYLNDLDAESVEVESRAGSVNISFKTNEAELILAISQAETNATGVVTFVNGLVPGEILTVNTPQVQVKTAKITWDGEFAYCDVVADIVPNAQNNDLTIVQS